VPQRLHFFLIDLKFLVDKEVALNELLVLEFVLEIPERLNLGLAGLAFYQGILRLSCSNHYSQKRYSDTFLTEGA